MALSNTSKLMRAPCYLRNLTSSNVKTAGILSDELLKGDVIDCNSPHITKTLHNLGVKVKKISFIGDVVDEISDEIRTFSNSYNFVITTGGIGPTHDDVTFEAAAKAFNVPLTVHPQLRSLCERFYNTRDANHPGMKLAAVPETCKLYFAEGSNYPNVAVENVYMFPGIPELFLKSFLGLSSQLFSSGGTHFHTKCIFVNLTEDLIAQELQVLEQEFPNIQVGSYPRLFHKLYKVKIMIESTDEHLAEAACARLLEKLPADAIVDLDPNCSN